MYKESKNIDIIQIDVDTMQIQLQGKDAATVRSVCTDAYADNNTNTDINIDTDTVANADIKVDILQRSLKRFYSRCGYKYRNRSTYLAKILSEILQQM